MKLATRKQPWLAALLSVAVVGLGHIYLRRWKRAVGWLVVLFASTAFFVDPTALHALATGGSVDLIGFAPVIGVGSLNVVDAYLLAHVQNTLYGTFGTRENVTHCPSCGRVVDPDLDFCHWCSTTLEQDADVGPSETGVNHP